MAGSSSTSSGRYRGIPWNARAGKRGKSATFDHWHQADAYWRRVEAEMDGDYGTVGIAVSRRQRGPRFAEHVWPVTNDLAKTGTKEAGLAAGQ